MTASPSVIALARAPGVTLDVKAPAIDDSGQTLIGNLELTQRTLKAA